MQRTRQSCLRAAAQLDLHAADSALLPVLWSSATTPDYASTDVYSPAPIGGCTRTSSLSSSAVSERSEAAIACSGCSRECLVESPVT